MTICTDKDKTLSENNIKGEENSLNTFNKKEKVCDVYVTMYECGKHL